MSGQIVQVNQYQVELGRELGRGGYGAVFACKILNIQDDQYCIKIIQTFDETSTRREAEILNLLSQKGQFNQNLVRVKTVDFNEQQKKMLVVMEKCESNLQTQWEMKKQLTTLEVRDFLKQILNGYKTLYENSIVHRDLKPENILINSVGDKLVYKLADFGVGKIYKKNDFIATKSTGTPVYSAPECNPLFSFNGCDEDLEKDIDDCKQKSSIDIYSIGIILYQLLFGTFPFPTTAPGIYQFLQNLKHNPIEIPQIRNQDQQLVVLIKNMIVYYPTKRIKFDDLYKLFFEDQLTQTKFTFQKKQQSENQSNQTFSTQDSNQKVKLPSPPRQDNRIVTQIHNPHPNQVFWQPENIPQRMPTQPHPQPPIRIMTINPPRFQQNHEISKQKLMIELKETLSFLLDSMVNITQQQEVFNSKLKNTLAALNQCDLSNQQHVVFNLSGIKDQFKYFPNKNYSKSYIRFLFIFTYFAYGKFIQDPGQVSLEQMEIYLQKWFE